MEATHLSGSSSGSVRRLQSRPRTRLQSSQGPTAAEEYISKVYTAFGRRPQQLTTGTSPRGCLSVLMTWKLISPRISAQA